MRKPAACALMMLGLCSAAPIAAAQVAELDPIVTTSLSKPERPRADENAVRLGVYDPHGEFSAERSVAVEHIFVYWQALDLEPFRRTLRYAEERGRTLMITIEPYTRAENWRDGGDRLFADILAGDFDPEIETICRELAGYRGDVLVRWGHEMEDPDGRYPWARSDSDGYKAAYRYVVDKCRADAPKAAFVWSPKGGSNLADYYPGDAHVDAVGVALWGLEQYDVKFHGGARSFAETFSEKYPRVAAFLKPVIIAELGVSGSAAYRERWFAGLIAEISRKSRFPQLEAVVYFNDKEPWHWPLGLGSPDWRIAKGWFSRAEQAAKQP